MTGTRVYNVKSTLPINDMNNVLSAAGLPAMGAAWDSLLTILVVVARTPIEVNKELGFYQVQIDYDTDETLANWKVEVRTTKKTFAPQRTLAPYSNAPTDPFSAGRYIGPAGIGGDETKSGYAPLNRASDPFETPPKIDYYLQRIILSRTVASLSDIGNSNITGMESIVNYLGTVNDGSEQIAGLTGLAWTFLVDDISFERIYRSDGGYNTKVTFQILFDNTNTHASAILNAGFRETFTNADGDTGIRDVSNTSGKVSKKPSLLNTSGVGIKIKYAPRGATGAIGPDGPPYYIVCPFRAEMDFGDLELPDTWT